MTAIQFPTAWLRRVAGFAALAAVLALAACGGGSGAPNNPFAPGPAPTVPLTITPQSPTVYSQVATTLTINGGVAPYQAFSNNVAVLPVVQSLPGSTVTLLAATVQSLTLVTVTIRDAAGSEASTVVTILPGPATPPPALVVLPSPVDVFAGTAAQLTIAGGVAPYSAFSSNSAVLPVVQTVAGNIVNLLANDVSASTVVVVTIRDAVGQTTPVTVTVRPKSATPAPPLVVLPNNVVMSKALPVTITISGGLPPYKAYSSNPAVIPVNQSVAGNSIVLTAGAVVANTNVAITVQDSAGQTVTVAVVVQPESSTPPPTLAFLPPSAVIFSGVATSVYITGGVPPYRVFSSNPTVLPVTQDVSGTAVPLLAGNVSTETEVTLTVQDSDNKTATATITVQAAPVLSALTIKPNFADCGTNAICSGQTGTVTVKVQLPGGGAAPGRQIRFDVVAGPYTIVPAGAASGALSVTVTSDSAGNAQVIIRANVDAPTQPAQIRVTDIASGQQLTGDFLIQQRTDGATILTVVPPEVTFRAPYLGECTSGFRADYFIYGGTPPYRITQAFPDATVLFGTTGPGGSSAIVTASGGYFEVISNGTCVNPQTFSIVDANGRQTTARFFNLEGTVARPPAAPPALVVTPSAFGSSQAPTACAGNTFRFVVTGGTSPYNVYQVDRDDPIAAPTPLTQSSQAAQTIASEGLFFDITFKADTAIGSGDSFSFQVIDAGSPQRSRTVSITCSAFSP